MPYTAILKARAYLCIYHAIFRTGNKNKAFDLHKISEFGRIEFAYANGVGLFARSGERFAKMSNKG